MADSERRFSPATDIATHTPLKQSVQRSLRADILAQWAIEPETLEAVWPKKEGLVLVKWSVALRYYYLRRSQRSSGLSRARLLPHTHS